MNINSIILLYALDELTRDDLKKVFEGIGFSSVIVDVLLTKANNKKAMVEFEKANRIDASKFFAPYDECVPVSVCPSGSLDKGREVYDPEKPQGLFSVLQNPDKREGWADTINAEMQGGL
jgi:hypothetical protein